MGILSKFFVPHSAIRLISYEVVLIDQIMIDRPVAPSFEVRIILGSDPGEKNAHEEASCRRLCRGVFLRAQQELLYVDQSDGVRHRASTHLFDG
jgi:hypothetical protein